MQPAKHTPLIALPVLVLDLETTGLDVRKDRVIQIGAMDMQGASMEESLLINQLINPGIPIPRSSTEIHHIKDEDVADAPYLHDVAKTLVDAMKKKVVVGQHIAFDLAILKREFARHNLVWHEPVSLDVSMLVGALQPALFDVSLESVTTFLGVTITDRHTAHGDCLATANSWQKLIPLLQKKNIRTLGEAIALSSQRQDLIARQMESGWLEHPDGLVISKPATTERIDSYVFKHRIANVMTRPAPFVKAATSIRNAAKKILEQKLGCILIRNKSSDPKGILTEKDIMRIAAEGKVDLDTTEVEVVMSSPVETINQDDMLYRALARMDRLDISYLCVVDDSDNAVGIVSQRNLLEYRARESTMMYDAMETARDVDTLAAAYGQLVSVAAHLAQEDLDGAEVAKVVSCELQTLVSRATQLAIQRMQKEDSGDAPADWCVLVLGSGGRGESLLSTDQDNALIHTGSEKDDAWFAQFGGYFTEILDTAGLPYCDGGVMISNKQWRGNIEDWNKRVSHWINRGRSEDLLNVDIFFDAMPVAGNFALAQRLHREAVALASTSHPFINLLTQSVKSVTPQFSMFGGRLTLTEGRVDLKRNGLLPLVSFARTLALRIGSTARSTQQRIRETMLTGRLPESDAERLIEIHKLLLTIVLKQQLRDSEEGIAPSTHVDIKQLNRRENYRLIHELHYLDMMVDQINSFTAN